MNVFAKWFHRHKWYTVSSAKGRVTVSSMISRPEKVRCLLKIEKCSVCGLNRGRMITAVMSETMDIDYLISITEGELHI